MQATGTAVWGEAGWYLTPAISRIAGQLIVGKTALDDGSSLMWGLTSLTTHAFTGFNNLGFTTGTNTIAVRGTTAGGSPDILAYTPGTYYPWTIALRSTGKQVFIKVGSTWRLLYTDALSSAASIYVGSTMLGSTKNHYEEFIRIPTALWLPTPLLSDGFGSTFGTSNGLGHAEGVAGGLGSGGSGKVWTDAGTWATAGGVVANTPVSGGELFTDPGLEGTYTAGLCAAFAKTGSPTLAQSADVHGGSKAQAFTAAAQYNDIKHLITTTSVGKWYVASMWGKRTAGTAGRVTVRIDATGINKSLQGATGYSYITSADYQEKKGTFRNTSSEVGGRVNFQVLEIDAASFDAVLVDDFSVKLLPISTLITNQVLSTTDVLVEATVSAFSSSVTPFTISQAGIVQSDRSFAAKCASTAAAGQAVIALKEVTGVGGVGLAVTDGITVNGTIYTIASVAGGSNVAYDDTAKTQTVTLGTNLGAEVATDAKVGLDWASWNGSLTYFDGIGNIKLDEVKAGVYTNRLSAAKAFSANARFIVRKIGTEYRVFYNEALIGTLTTVDALAMVGTYWGMFSTLAANTITSFVTYDTGNVTNAYSDLDGYSQDSSSLILPKEYCPDSYWIPEVANG
jgi:hypothetical protein